MSIAKHSGVLSISVSNESNIGSYLGSWDFGYDKPRVVIPYVTDSNGTKPLPIPGSTIYQEIHWTEPVSNEIENKKGS